MKQKNEPDPNAKNETSFNLHLPGLQKSVNVPFLRKMLPVCDKCKGQFKSRHLCREKKKHKNLPWCPVFICITIDESCIDKDRNCLIDNSLAYAISDPSQEWRRYMFKDIVEKQELDVSSILIDQKRERGGFDSERKEDPCLPMCQDCKTKNYTSAYCRERRPDLVHRYLPWNTIYVDMSLSEKEKAQTLRNNTNNNDTQKGTGDDENRQKSVTMSHDQNRMYYSSQNDENITVDNFFSHVDESRTFFVQISSNMYKIQWVDFDSDDNEERTRTASRSTLKRKQRGRSSSSAVSSNSRETPSQQLQNTLSNNAFYEFPIPPYDRHYPSEHHYYDSMPPYYYPGRCYPAPMPSLQPPPPPPPPHNGYSSSSSAHLGVGYYDSYHPQHSYSSSSFSSGMRPAPHYMNSAGSYGTSSSPYLQDVSPIRTTGSSRAFECSSGENDLTKHSHNQGNSSSYHFNPSHNSPAYHNPERSTSDGPEARSTSMLPKISTSTPLLDSPNVPSIRPQVTKDSRNNDRRTAGVDYDDNNTDAFANECFSSSELIMPPMPSAQSVGFDDINRSPYYTISNGHTAEPSRDYADQNNSDQQQLMSDKMKSEGGGEHILRPSLTHAPYASNDGFFSPMNNKKKAKIFTFS